MDCSGEFGNQACNGGWMDQAFEYAKTNALETEEDYPYTAESYANCTVNESLGRVLVTSYVDVAPNDPDQLKAAVAIGVVSGAMAADSQVFQFYTGGIVNDESCGSQVNHSAAIVGYGNEDGQEYWIFKNSWGPAWGDNGYIRIANSGVKDSGICGVNSINSYVYTKTA